VIDAVNAVAAERGVPPSHIALAWLFAKKEVAAPIVGVSRSAQIDEAIASVGLTLSAEEMRRLEEHYAPRCPTDIYDAPPFSGGVTVKNH